MKFRHIYIIWFALVIISIFSIGCNNYNDPSTENAIPQSTNISIGELRRLIGSGSQTIEKELIIGGYVTSSDQAGNFYRTLTIEDFTGAVEIMAGLYDLHNLFPAGYYVIVRLQGCTVAQHYGVLQVGLAPKSYSSYPTDYFASRQALDKHMTCYDVVRHIAPSPQTIASLEKDMCGRLVTIRDLSLCSALHAEGWQVNTDGKWKGYNFFCDKSGNQIAVYTSEYANYTDNKIPTAGVALTGILQYGKADGEEYYMIKMRDEKDCQILP